MTGIWEGFIAAFAFGTVSYFIVSGLWVIAMFWCVEKENNFFSALWLILYLLFLQILVKVNFLGGIIHEPIKALLWVLGYIVLGFCWSFVKWWLYVNKEAEIYKENRMNFLEGFKKSLQTKIERVGGDESKKLLLSLDIITLDTKIPDALMQEWRRSTLHRFSIPKVHENKSKIALWIIYWPVSLIWSLINDFIKKFVKTLVMKLRVLYDGITQYAYRNIEKDDL